MVHLDNAVVESDQILGFGDFGFSVGFDAQIREERFDDIQIATDDGFSLDERQVRVQELSVRDFSRISRFATLGRWPVVRVRLHLLLESDERVFDLVDDFLQDRLLIRKLGARRGRLRLLMG